MQYTMVLTDSIANDPSTVGLTFLENPNAGFEEINAAQTNGSAILRGAQPSFPRGPTPVMHGIPGSGLFQGTHHNGQKTYSLQYGPQGNAILQVQFPQAPQFLFTCNGHIMEPPLVLVAPLRPIDFSQLNPETPPPSERRVTPPPPAPSIWDLFRFAPRDRDAESEPRTTPRPTPRPAPKPAKVVTVKYVNEKEDDCPSCVAFEKELKEEVLKLGGGIKFESFADEEERLKKEHKMKKYPYMLVVVGDGTTEEVKASFEGKRALRDVVNAAKAQLETR